VYPPPPTPRPPLSLPPPPTHPSPPSGQIILWTSVILVASVLGTVYFMLDMDSKKDPQLYAQIVDTRAAVQGGGGSNKPGGGR
jgi:hypothetical protein